MDEENKQKQVRKAHDEKNGKPSHTRTPGLYQPVDHLYNSLYIADPYSPEKMGLCSGQVN